MKFNNQNAAGFLFVLLLLTGNTIVYGQPTGTYIVNYRYNAGGCYPPNTNPYYCNYIPPGPIHIDADPGLYHILTTSIVNGGANAYVWSGDASSGAQYPILSEGQVLNFNHTHGKITLYAYDWYAGDNNSNQLTELRFVQALTCEGFEPPLEHALSVNKKSKRAVPVKMILTDSNGFAVDDTMIAPPIIDVSYNGSTGSSILGYDGGLLPSGLSDDGNEFRYEYDYDLNDSLWIINLGMKAYTASGEYTISAKSGDSSYILEGCTQTITRSP